MVGGHSVFSFVYRLISGGAENYDFRLCKRVLLRMSKWEFLE